MSKSKPNQEIAVLKNNTGIKNNGDMARLHFYGAAQMVSGSNYLLEVKKRKILIDCGIFHGFAVADKNHEPFPYDPKTIDYLLITHAHFDHIGRVPKLVKEGFSGKIYATPPTIDMARLMFEDSQRLMKEGTTKDGAESLVEGDVDKIMSLFNPIGYDERLELDKDIICFYRDAGHVLGSAMIEVWIRKKARQGEFTKIAFSGDIGNPSLLSFALLNKPSYLKNPDYVVMESTYGDRNHDTSKDAKDLLEDVIEGAVAHNGVLMVPISAMERTQQVLYHLNELAENKRIPYVPIYVDSPLAIRLTEVYQKHNIYLNKDVRELIGAGEAIFRFPGLSYTISVNESKMINRVPPPKIILAGSGMSTGGRIIHHEMRYLSDPHSTLLVVSYQAKGTLGRRIQEGAREVQLGEERVVVNARVETIGHYSDHMDQSELLKWVAYFKNSVKKVFITHGDEEVATTLRQFIMDNLGIRPEIPKMDEVFEIDITK